MLATRSTRRRLSAEERRSRLLVAASAEFGKHGYSDASLRSIAASAGITTPVVYDHFGSKAELYATVAQQHADSLLARWAEPPPGSTEDLVRATVDSVFGWIEEHPDGWRVLFADVPADPVVAATLRPLQDRATAGVAGLLATLPTLDHPADVTRERSDAAYAEAAKSAVDGLASWWWHNRDVPRATVVTLAADLLWRGLRELSRTDARGGVSA